MAQAPEREPTLQDIHDSLDIPGHRVEILGGRIIVDPYEATLTLCCEPAEDRYRLIHSVDAGDKLDVPEPFGTTLDTATMPIRRRNG